MHISLALLLPLLSSIQAIALPTCQTQSQPNPVAAQYPQLTTGTVNGTIAILPISLKLARKLIPSQYGILVDSYRSLLPSFSKDMYPAMLQSELDHDIKNSIISIPDFSVSERAWTQTSSEQLLIIRRDRRSRFPLSIA